MFIPHLIIGGVDTALGGLGGPNGIANALNNSNQVVGWSQLSGGAQHAFLYSNGAMQDLNLLIPPLSGITLVARSESIRPATSWRMVQTLRAR